MHLSQPAPHASNPQASSLSRAHVTHKLRQHEERQLDAMQRRSEHWLKHRGLCLWVVPHPPQPGEVDVLLVATGRET